MEKSTIIEILPFITFAIAWLYFYFAAINGHLDKLFKKKAVKKVKIYKQTAEGKQYVASGIFHQFSSGPSQDHTGTTATAIVETPNGEVLNIPVEFITFYDER
ncbi:MAG: hypothetical protein KTR20_12705 [Cellvibrionaceae bacterium]|nr:hypothetical protein [Cellvibrionaceae bacterium]